jgi:hypothetical protein
MGAGFVVGAGPQPEDCLSFPVGGPLASLRGEAVASASAVAAFVAGIIVGFCGFCGQVLTVDVSSFEPELHLLLLRPLRPDVGLGGCGCLAAGLHRPRLIHLRPFFGLGGRGFRDQTSSSVTAASAANILPRRSRFSQQVFIVGCCGFCGRAL